MQDNKRDMLDPSINSVLELMRSAKKAGTVKSFVYTSSWVQSYFLPASPIELTLLCLSGAAYADHTQVRPEGYIIGEKDWCPITVGVLHPSRTSLLTPEIPAVRGGCCAPR